MERESPFAEEMFWKRLIGTVLIVGGAAGLVMIFGGEIFNGGDMAIGIICGVMILGGLGLFLAPDPARL